MSAWIVVPCLLTLRDEFNKVSPSRDKGADGTIGDSAHTSTSDHTPDEDSDILRDHDADSKNEVHALDIDSSGPWPGGWAWFNAAVLALVEREKADYESATTIGRLQYVIWNGRIASRSWGWTWRDYAGSDPHTNHAHFSARYLTEAESSTRPWGVEGDEMTQTEFNTLMTTWATSSAGKTALAVAVLSHDPGADANGKINPGGVPNPGPDAASNPTLAPGTSLAHATRAYLGTQALTTQLAAVATAVGAIGTIDAAVIAAAIPADLAAQVAQELAERLAS